MVEKGVVGYNRILLEDIEDIESIDWNTYIPN